LVTSINTLLYKADIFHFYVETCISWFVVWSWGITLAEYFWSEIFFYFWLFLVRNFWLLTDFLFLFLLEESLVVYYYVFDKLIWYYLRVILLFFFIREELTNLPAFWQNEGKYRNFGCFRGPKMKVAEGWNHNNRKPHVVPRLIENLIST